MSLRFFPIAILCALFFSVCAEAQSAKPLVFDSTPIQDLDESGRFNSCGYQFRARLDQDNWSTLLQVVIYKNSNDDYFVSTGFSERSTASSGWSPKNSVVQWVRVGAAEPLTLDPYNLVTVRDRGISTFSVKKNRSYNLFREAEKAGGTLWVQILDKENNSERTYSGVIAIDENSVYMTRQCIESLHGPQ